MAKANKERFELAVKAPSKGLLGKVVSEVNRLLRVKKHCKEGEKKTRSSAPHVVR